MKDYTEISHIGERVFINSGCKFQDQGGIFIGDDCLIGHNATLCTINHNPDPEHRGDMVFKPIHIENKVWLGANVTICPGNHGVSSSQVALPRIKSNSVSHLNGFMSKA